MSWITSTAARPAVLTAIVLFVAVVAAGLLAAWIASAAIRRVVAQRDREAKTAAIAALVDAATEASVWNSLTPQGPLLFICESIGGQRAECLTPGEGEIRLSRRLSDSPCEQGRSWGVTAGRVWVSEGCRGEFELKVP